MRLERLELTGFDNVTVPNTFIRQDHSEHLAIVFPGLGYNADMPLLYYIARLLTHKNADVLQLRYDYQTKAFQSLSPNVQQQRIITDCTAAYDAAMKHSYSKITLVGKSLGTLALGQLLTTRADLTRTTFIYLTPLFRQKHLHEQILSVKHRSLFVIGTKDSHYDPQVLAETEQATGGESLVIEGANHSLECDNPLESPRIMQNVLERLEKIIVK